MKIIIEVKDTALLNRIDEFSRALAVIERTPHGILEYIKIDGFSDVIASISKEW